MKKLTSFLLIFAMLILIIYLPSFEIKTSTEEILPDEDKMVPGKYVFAEEDRNDKIITTEEEFNSMVPGGKYSLGCDITLTNHEPLFKDKSNITKGGIRFDGGGYTITTDNMLFYRLPRDSVFANFVISGNIAIDASIVNGTKNLPQGGNAADYANPYYSLASLCGNSHGGTFKNIINKAYVTANAGSENSTYALRVSGLVGSCDDAIPLLIQNCRNEGRVWAQVNGQNFAVAGILAYSDATAYLMGCRNDGQIKNTAKSGSYVYAGGILGVKSASSICQILNSSTVIATDKTADDKKENMIIARTYAGAGCDGCTAIANNSNTTYFKDAKPVGSPEAFAKMSGEGIYYLTETFCITKQNKNSFTGALYGATRTLTAQVPPFADHNFNNQLNDVEITIEGWTKINTAEEFLAIRNDGTSTDYKGYPNTENKYYLGADIDLASAYPNWEGPDFWSGSDSNTENDNNNQPNIILDGCGYTVTTKKPIFPELPGGGAGNDGTHSIIRNLVIEGDISLNSLYKYNNDKSVGALVGKANGGVFENITNNANINIESNTSIEANVGGIIGSVFSDDIIMLNCKNNGNITAPVVGNIHGVGGIIGLIGYDADDSAQGISAKIINCSNSGNVKNTSEAFENMFAGGIAGVKYAESTTAYLIDCYNEGKIFAKTAYGNYFADRLQQNSHIIKTIPITNEAEFMNISGHRAYSLAADIKISSRNMNAFDGFLIGNGHSVITPDRLFDNSPNAVLIEVDVDPTNLVID